MNAFFYKTFLTNQYTIINTITVPKQPNFVFFAAKNAAINAIKFFIVI